MSPNLRRYSLITSLDALIRLAFIKAILRQRHPAVNQLLNYRRL
jgi:hypothetical protein